MSRRATILTVAASSALTAVVLRRGRRPAAQVTWAPSTGKPSPGPLAGRIVGEGPLTVLLVHGMFNASSYWGAAYDRLTQNPTPGRLLAVDLAGFGRSMDVESRYDPDAQADAIAATLLAAGADRPVAVGAHSIGTVVAVALAARHPHLVAGIAAFSPPWYENRASARAHLASTDPLARLLLSDTDLARRACELMCRHRRAATVLIRLARPNLPHLLAADRVRHTWTSYAESLRQLVLAGHAPGQLDRLTYPSTSSSATTTRPSTHPFSTRSPNATRT
ncbi:alpha/beta hydrolase [Iamia sp.]|uniref:alpha/beta fold hydrolase n=1 Tax=Iamia sp. TaxID=2722710 RepID=UPI002C39E239|nr:alpha/beta hydrolase [Iamia sp.]HXH58998.1 alpha/beta hydrolase [Iamia sp.]